MKKNLTIILIGVLIGGVLVYKYSPQIKTETITKDHVVTIIKHIKHPDGTEETDTKKVEDREKKKEQIVAAPSKDWHVSVGAGISVNNLVKPVYKLEVNRRILGPVTVGAWGTTEKMVGLTLGLQF